MHKSIFGSRIKSIMLEELAACELRTIINYRYLFYGALWVVVLNIGYTTFANRIYDPNWGEIIWYMSGVIAALYLVMFLLTFEKVFSFFAPGMVLDFQIKWMDFEEREGFISKVEQAKDKRRQALFNNG